MAQTTVITITHGTESLRTIQDMLKRPASKPKDEAITVSNFFRAAVAGNRSCKFDVQVSGGSSVAATGTVTLAAMVAADTVTVASVVFTCVASGATGNQFNLGGTDTITATNLAAAINASASLSQVAMATSTGPVVTVTAALKGKIGNSLGLAISLHGSVSGALLTGGVNTTANVYRLGV